MKFTPDLWRPLVLYGGMGLFIVATLWVAGAGSLPHSWGLIVFIPGTTGILGAVVVLRAFVPLRRFLQGMRDVGEAVEILEEGAGWFGGYTAHVRTAQGLWELHSWAGESTHLEVRVPGAKRPRLVVSNPREAGKKAASAQVRAGPSKGPVVPPSALRVGGELSDAGEYHLGLATLFIAASLGVTVLAAWGITEIRGSALNALLHAAYWVGVGFAWGIVSIMGFSLAYRRWPERVQRLGRPGVSALLLVTLGVGQTFLGLTTAGMILILKTLPLSFFHPFLLGVMPALSLPNPMGCLLIAAGGGFLVLLFGVWVLTVASGWERLQLSLGSIGGAVCALLLPGFLFAAVSLLLSALALFQAWNPAPTTTEPDEEPWEENYD